MYFLCMQDSWSVTQEETKRQETDGIQNPRAKRPLPSHRPGNSRTLLVLSTYTHMRFILMLYGKQPEKDTLIIPWFHPHVIFSTFGELKTVRLPKKAAGSGNHRGFGFIDFITKQDAKVCIIYVFRLKHCCNKNDHYLNTNYAPVFSPESICCTVSQHPSVRPTPRAGVGWRWGNSGDTEAENSWTFSW